MLDKTAERASRWDESSKVFVYAEHNRPITTILTFPSESMVLSADESGQVRLWQAPNTRHSDMLLGCESRLGSMEMTFDLSRGRWRVDDFKTTINQDNAQELRLKKTIERFTLEHSLEYETAPGN